MTENIAENLALLQSKLGQEVHVSEWLTVSQERINAFAAATDDEQWIHVDVERAQRESPYGGPIAHGYLTLSLLVPLRGLVDASQPYLPGAKQVINYGLNKLALLVLGLGAEQTDGADLHLPARVGAAGPVHAHRLLHVELLIEHLGELHRVALGVDLGLSAELIASAGHSTLGEATRGH